MSQALTIAGVVVVAMLAPPCEAKSYHCLARKYITTLGKVLGSQAPPASMRELRTADIRLFSKPEDAFPPGAQGGTLESSEATLGQLQTVVFKPGFSFTIDEIIVGGQPTARTAVVYARSTNAFFRTNNMPYKQQHVFRLRFRGTKVQEQTEFVDSLLVTQAFFPDILRARCLSA